MSRQLKDVQAAIIDPFFSPATLAMHLWADGDRAWVPAKHLRYASERIAAAILKKGSRLIISMPPQHGKSQLATQTTIPWFLEKFPGQAMMQVSYNQDFAESWGGKVKDIIEGHPDLFKIRIREDRSRVDRFETTSGSVCHFLGINSGQTGKDAGLIIIDDYVKGFAEASSQAIRDKTWNDYVANIELRMQNDTTVIIIATRWWSDDLIGRLLKVDPTGWEYICFPAFATENDLLGRKPGDVLFPEKQSRELLLKKKKTAQLSGVIFDALYQQTPVDNQSKFTDGQWLKVVHGIDEGELNFVRAWDFAATEGGGDFTTGLKMGRRGMMRQAYITNIISEQLSPARVEQKIRSTAVADGIECTIILEQEPGAQAKSLCEYYQKRVLPEFNVILVPTAGKTKFMRAQPFISGVETGNVFCVDSSGHNSLEEAEWITSFRTDFDNFGPQTIGHDDKMDTAGMAYNHLFEDEASLVAWGQAADELAETSLTLGIGNEARTIVRKPLSEDLDSLYAKRPQDRKLVRGCTW